MNRWDSLAKLASDDEAAEVLFRSFFDELGQIQRDSLEKQAGIGAVGSLVAGAARLGSRAAPQLQHASKLWSAGRAALRNPRGAMNLMRGTFQRGGGGWQGIKAVGATPVGQVAGIAGLGAAGTVGAGARALAGPRPPKPPTAPGPR